MADSIKNSIAVKRYIHMDAQVNYAQEMPLSLKIEKF